MAGLLRFLPPTSRKRESINPMAVQPKNQRPAVTGPELPRVGYVDIFVNTGLLIIFILVLVLPFKVKTVERNLEFFLFLCGIGALTLSGFAAIPGETTGWNARIVFEALTTPLNIATIAGIPVGIVQIVLVVGIVIYLFHRQLQDAFTRLIGKVPLTIIVPSVIIILGLVSSIISAILAAIILVEIVNALPVGRQSKIELVVVACFSIGLGAGLTPLGEPLSTIVISSYPVRRTMRGSDSSSRTWASLSSRRFWALGSSGFSSSGDPIPGIPFSNASLNAKNRLTWWSVPARCTSSSWPSSFSARGSSP